MKEKIDLHNHTFGSDGKQTVLKLMKRAKLEDINIVAVADHDSVEGFHYFQHEIYKITQKIEVKKDKKNAKRLLNFIENIKLIKGAELICSYKGNIIEILAYNYELEKMAQEIENMKKGLKTRVELFYEKFYQVIKEKNLVIDMENLNKAYKNALEEERNEKSKVFYHDNIKIKVVNKKKIGIAGPFFKELIKNDNNIPYLQYEENGIIKQANTVKEFITKHIYNKNSIFYVDVSYTRPSCKKTIEAIHRAGGKAFLAHPGRYIGKIELEKDLDEIISIGLDGIEVWYPDHSKELSDFLLRKAIQYNILASGGNDDHCVPKEGIRYKLGNCKVPRLEQTEWIYSTIEEKRDFINSDNILIECKNRLKNIIKK